jgi:hypothetical protein
LPYGADLLDQARKRPLLYNDFLAASGSSSDPFVGAALASGTLNTAASGRISAQHPGQVRIRSSTTTLSGAHIGTSTTTGMILLGGGEIFESIFLIDTLSGSTFRFGFYDSVTSSAPTDAAYVEIDGSGVATGKTYSNGSTSSTGTTYTVSATGWYRLRVTLNSAGTQVTFAIYNDSGTQLWSDTLSTNIPTASGRETHVGTMAINSGTTAIDLMHLDWMALAWSSDRTR